ncbi:MAG: nucleoside-diphosphate-sugar epimerase, partial [Myxococcota bacterium]
MTAPKTPTKTATQEATVTAPKAAAKAAKPAKAVKAAKVTKTTKSAKKAAPETIFITGGTGFLGSYVVTDLLDAHPGIKMLILTRAKNDAAAREKLWRSLQLHLSPERFNAAMTQIEVIKGDLHAPNLGIDPKIYTRLTKTVDSVLHIAASLNRKSAKACLNSNLRGTL